ncbi:hypothetical protein llg_39400 [Luteolibacter sp. LG18]|nr:hypothetical protein llg_39400 [Luteolibacter sp. LG18]
MLGWLVSEGMSHPFEMISQWLCQPPRPPFNPFMECDLRFGIAGTGPGILCTVHEESMHYAKPLHGGGFPHG